MVDNPRRIKSYVLRAARMSEAQKLAYDKLSPRWCVSHDQVFDWEHHFPQASRRVVEIGFGMGDATRRLAVHQKDWGILGVEVHRPGVGKLLWWMDEEKIENIRIVEHDAVEVLQKAIAPESVDGVHIWFPDPWPKKRHHKRRLIQVEFISLVMQILRPGGYIHAATDWQPYADHILETLQSVSGLSNKYPDWAPKPEYRPDTKFEARGVAADRVIRDIVFEKEAL
ncbi:MAG: tRNA (guanosine(46)-N7)-methyltransferase TrmB [Spirochaetales bacterium]|nr:tRNA (guanosine(46)-N7)-methyltransferase TrmB [Spirochaetales bacterium]